MIQPRYKLVEKYYNIFEKCLYYLGVLENNIY